MSPSRSIPPPSQCAPPPRPPQPPLQPFHEHELRASARHLRVLSPWRTRPIPRAWASAGAHASTRRRSRSGAHMRDSAQAE
eukprot:scaffold118515_cov28-Tisochrysis_lutea.AAC.9